MFHVDLERVKLAIAFSHPKTYKKAAFRVCPTCNGKPVADAVCRTCKNDVVIPAPSQRRTHCEIYKIEASGKITPITEGWTACSKYDQFNKEQGRKHALQRALCQHLPNHRHRPVTCSKCGGRFNSYSYSILRLSKGERFKVWEAYFNRGLVQNQNTVKTEDIKAAMVAPAGQVPPENKNGTMWAGAD